MNRECKKHGFVKHYKNDRCSVCSSENVKNRRRKIKEMAVAYKGGKCEKCGYDKCNAALEFHHYDSTNKDFGIGERGYARAWEKVKKELDKCMMVCSNCHREIHYEKYVST